MNKIANLIKDLNKPRLGAFGEFIFKSIASKKDLDIKAEHRNRVDYIVDGIPVDVGTSNRINKKPLSSQIKKKDAHVLFFTDHVVVKWNDKLNEILDENTVLDYFNLWTNSKRNKSSVSSSIYKDELISLKSELSSFFKNHGFEVRIIYRTISKEFGYRESPHNLLPSNIEDGKINIYLDFKDEKTKRDNINFIIAFKSSDSNLIPKQAKVSVNSGSHGISKIDLSSILKTKEKPFYGSLEKLFRDFFA